MQKVYSIWIEPGAKIKQFIRKNRWSLAGVDSGDGLDAGGLNFARALPPWLLLLTDDFSPPPPTERPFWLSDAQGQGQADRLSDRIIRRDRSSAYYSSPGLRVLPGVRELSCPLPGVCAGLMVEMEGGELPDLRLYNGEYRVAPGGGAPLPCLAASVELCVPLFWGLDGAAGRELAELVEDGLRGWRSAIHLVELRIEWGAAGGRIGWESLVQVDLKRAGR